MKLQYRNFFALFLLSFLFACSTPEELFVDYANPEISYAGRIDQSNLESADLYWPGSSLQLNFEGESIAALLQDETGENYYNVIIDRDSPYILYLDSSKRSYQLASGLKNGKHSIEIFKRTEWNKGKTSFYGFQINGHSKVLPKTPAKKRKIEFYGNSITSGYGIEDLSGKDSPDSTYTNNYLSYSAITARHFDAEYHCISKGGIGITVSWFPLIMPEMYNRLIPENPNSRWDFSLFTPDLVVVNLFQNDSWIVNMPDYPEFKARFGSQTPDADFIIKAYANFISSIRKEYPNAHIICMLGNMDATQEGSIWPDYIKSAVKELNDPKIFSFFMPYKNTPGHPNVAEHQEMANSLIQFIENTIDW